jgi:hypothetical protein
VRLVLAEGTERAERMVGNELKQAFGSQPSERIRFEKDGFVVLDFGREMHGGVALLCSVNAGRVRIRFGESVSEVMGQPDQDHSIHDAVLELPRTGTLEYGQTGFRFIRVDALDEVELLNIIAVTLELEPELLGHFESSDERLNRIWHTAVETVRLNMQNYIYDGIKRDRMVWMGDLHPEVKVILAAYGAHPIIPASLDFVRDHTPPGGFFNEITSYSLWWIITQHDYHQAGGDLDYLKEQRGCLLELLHRFAGFVGQHGSEQLPGRRFLDWPSNDEPQAVHAGLQGLLCWAFRCGEALCRYLEEPRTAELCRQRETQLRRHIPDCGENKAAAAMLTLGGIADRADVVLKNPLRGVSTFYGYYMLQAQPAPNALELIRRYWGAMLDYGATSFWEDFSLDWLPNAGRIDEPPEPGKADLHADFGNYCYKGLRHSLCHGWAAGPAAYLSENLLGITARAPGYRQVSIVSKPCDLEFAAGEFPTPQGVIRVRQRRNHPVEIELPPGIELVE